MVCMFVRMPEIRVQYVQENGQMRFFVFFFGPLNVQLKEQILAIQRYLDCNT